MPRLTIADACSRILEDRRALSAEELGEMVAAAGVTRAASPTRAVVSALNAQSRFHRLRDERWTVPSQLLSGAILTHRLSDRERDQGTIALDPDLALLASQLWGLMTPDGFLFEPVFGEAACERTGMDTDLALEGPPDWLADLPGPLVQVQLTGSIMRVMSGAEASPDSRLMARRIVETIRTTLEIESEADYVYVPPVVPLEEALLQLLVDAPDLLRQPLAPLGEILTGAGLEVHLGHVGLPGTDWELLDDYIDFDPEYGDDSWRVPGTHPGPTLDDEENAAELQAAVAEAYGLDDQDIDGLQLVLGAYELRAEMGELEGSDLQSRLAQIVAFPGIARVLWIHAWMDPELEPFMAGLADKALDEDAAGARFVLSACAEARGDVREAERLLRSSLSADSAFEPALVDLARFEVDRGQYDEALRMLRAAYIAADDPERHWLENVAQRALPKVGRNEPCPCGSGRKYKACHLDRPGGPDSVDTSAALLHKIRNWLSLPGPRRLLEALKVEAIPGDDDEQVDDERARVDQPILDDVFLFDRGGLASFLEVRGVLIPERERSLAHRWLGTGRSLYEVRSVRPGRALVLRDLATESDAFELVDRALSSQVETLDVLCLRLLTDDSGQVFASDGLRVPRLQRARVLDIIRSGDGIELLRWVARPYTVPRLANMEGEPLLMVTATYRVPDPDAAAAALGRKLVHEEKGRYVETVERRGQPWIRGSIKLAGSEATVSANSAQRAERLERMLLWAAPGAEIIRRQEESAETAIEAQRDAGPHASAVTGAEPLDPADHPELAAALDQMMRGYEERWVDESIPALGGLSPREALADATMRPELEAMLDDMAWQLRRAGGAGTMDPDRIRGHLGLKPPP